MDRQDIDALLIGALYGELTAADEARLTSHLDSHPTDRGALDDLKSARQAVRESRIFELQFDPPQAVSALLLQEAHRRAPKRVVVSDEKESWFYRFTKMFMAHPAMAAAAMLVLVVGVASMLYVKKGEDTFAAKQAPATQPTQQNEVVTAPTVPSGDLAKQDPAAAAEQPADSDGFAFHQGQGSGSSYRVGLDDKVTDQEATTTSSFGASRDRGGDTQQKVAKLKAQQDALERQGAKNNRKTATIVVDTPQPQPKELAEGKALDAKSPAKKGFDGNADSTVIAGSTGNGTFSTAPSAGAGGSPSGRTADNAGPARNVTPGQAAPQPPPPPANTTPPSTTVAQAPAAKSGTATKTPVPAKPTVTKEAEKTESKPAPPKDASLLAWAKGEHARAQSLAAKDCRAAAKVAIGIQNRAPDFFAQYVATDRALKKCQSYIAAERDAEAERSGKARAQKRTNADEPAAESAK